MLQHMPVVSKKVDVAFPCCAATAEGHHAAMYFNAKDQVMARLCSCVVCTCIPSVGVAGLCVAVVGRLSQGVSKL